VFGSYKVITVLLFNTWLLERAGKPVSMRDFAAVIRMAFREAITKETLNSFKKIGK
jgi:hypothetical protein